MKKILLCALLCICMLANLTACTSNKGTEDSTNTEEQTNASDKENTSEEIATQPVKPDISAAALELETTKHSRYNIDSSTWDNVFFQLEGINYQVPFSYARISKDWTFQLSDYGYDETFVLQPGERTTASVELTNTAYDYPMIVGFYNPYEVPITIEEAMVWSVTFSFDNSQSPYLPILPKELTKGNTVADVILTYGDPTTPYDHDEETSNFVFNYNSNYNKFLILTINASRGITAFTIQNYTMK